MDEKMIVKSFEQINENFVETVAANHDICRTLKKQAKKIRGIKGVLFGFGIGMLVLAAELMERKRSENYLQEEIDKIKEKQDGLSKDFYCNCGEVTDGGACDA